MQVIDGTGANAVELMMVLLWYVDSLKWEVSGSGSVCRLHAAFLLEQRASPGMWSWERGPDGRMVGAVMRSGTGTLEAGTIS